MAQHLPTNGPSRLLLAVVVLLHLSSTLAANVVSIREETAFKAQRVCARDCFVWNGSGDLIGLFGCRYPYQNECLCRTDLAPAATKHFSTCMDARCTVGPATGDISTAISIYNSYCVANGFEVTAAVAVPAKATTTSAGSQATKGAASPADTATTGQQPVADNSEPTQTSSSDATSKSSESGGGGGGKGGLSTGAMVGIIAPIVSAVLAAIGLLVRVYYSKKKVKQDEELHKKLTSDKSLSA